MSNSGGFYNKKTVSRRDEFFSRYRTSDGVTDILFKEIIDIVNVTSPSSLLDLGTGNGYLINNVFIGNQEKLRDSQLIGIDTSKEMLAEAKRRSSDIIKFINMDNFKLDFPDNHFNLIMAKAVSNISIPEVYKKLKRGGWFIAKEYGPGKGVVEIAKLLNMYSTNEDRGLFYWHELNKFPFRSVEYRTYSVLLDRRMEEIIDLLKTMNIFTKNKSRGDQYTYIKDFFGTNELKGIHSDPYILKAFK